MPLIQTIINSMPDTQPGEVITVRDANSGANVELDVQLLLIEDGLPTAMLVGPHGQPGTHLLLKTG